MSASDTEAAGLHILQKLLLLVSKEIVLKQKCNFRFPNRLLGWSREAVTCVAFLSCWEVCGMFNAKMLAEIKKTKRNSEWKSG